MNTNPTMRHPGLDNAVLASLEASGPVVGVRTTRIYCLPSCRPGRMPKPENCITFVNAAEAREAGFRPCKLCRPDEHRDPRAQTRSQKRYSTVRYGLGEIAIGFAFIAQTERGICGLYLLDNDDPAPGLARLRSEFPTARLVEDRSATAPVLQRIRAFVKEGQPCNDLPLDLRGTPFQIKVWNALRTIAYGSTCSYAELARRLKLPPSTARAVGAACGANPVSLLVPCHRVVGSNGHLCGYRWGLPKKQALLAREQSALVV